MNKKAMIAVVVVVVLILASALFLPIILEAIRGNVKKEQNQEEVEQDQEQPGEDMNGSIDDSVKDAIDEAWQIATIDASYAYISAIENNLMIHMLRESNISWNGTITGADGNHVTYVGDDGATITLTDITKFDITNVYLKVDNGIVTSGTMINSGYLLSFDGQEVMVVK